MPTLLTEKNWNDMVKEMIKKVLCNVFENDKKIDFLKVVHDGVHGTLSVQAFGIGSKVLLDYYICASATEEENEIKKFIDMIIA